MMNRLAALAAALLLCAPAAAHAGSEKPLVIYNGHQAQLPAGETLDVTASPLASNITGGGTQCVQASNTGVLSGTGAVCGTGSGSGTVSSVALSSTDNTITVNSGSPITTSGTIDLSAVKLKTARTFSYTGDATGGPTSFDGSGNVSTALTLATVNANVGSFGDATHVAAITVNGKGLITAASSVAITGGGGSGALVLLEQHTASSSASLDFTASISATYDEYLIELVGLVPATNSVNLYMRMSTNGGSSYDSSGVYSYATFGANRFGTGAGGNDGTAAQIQLNQSAIVNTSTASVVGFLRLANPASTSLHKRVKGELGFVNTATDETGMFSGAYRSTTAVDAFQFLFSSGNVASGTIRVYGIAK